MNSNNGWNKSKILVIILILACIGYITNQYFAAKSANNTRINATTIITKIEAIGKLELCKFEMQQVVEHTMQRSRFLPDAKLILIVVGQAVGCIDLKKIRKDDIRISESTVFVKLPAAELCYFRIDHQRSKVYDTDFELLDGSILTQNAYKQAETQIYQSAIQSGILNQTNQNAQKVLRPLLEQVSGGKKIVFEYSLKPID